MSVRSAATVIRALREAGYEVVAIGLDRQGRWLLLRESELEECIAAGHVADAGQPIELLPGAGAFAFRGSPRPVDVVFPVLHGRFGEDGCVQGLLELLDLPYVGAGVLGSAIGMDKEVQKQLLHAAGLPVVPYTVVRRVEWPQFASRVLGWAQDAPLPVFVKPANLGSSVGVAKAEDEAQLHEAVTLAFRFDSKVLVEKAYRVREIECAVLGNDEPVASVPGEIKPRHEFYSYEAKYLDPNGAELLVPAPIPDNLASQIRQLACRVFRVLQCAGMARVDFFLTDEGAIFINEINTIPGFTNISMYPTLWAASGVPLPQLVRRLVELALERYSESKRILSGRR